ncbi:MAG: polyprenyl synthetase family protein [Pyrinomonadaceae bacterium MAG19_C2-C3]|nr:polyprenyl synthetase family protein [Pyrinomonadaceae bacterium MAG19_C2-C3]
MPTLESTIGDAPTTFFDDLWSYVGRVRPRIEAALEHHLPLAAMPAGAGFNTVVRDAVFPGGKRLRPVLVLLGAEAVSCVAEDFRLEDYLAAAVAVEYVHTSSLIFDDLPCMDDARERRGQTALHVRHGEALAVLAGLNLMNASYGLVFDKVTADNRERAIAAHAELVNCIGASGMVVGQSIDLDASGAGDELRQLRNLKTSALMRLALVLGATLAGGNRNQIAALSDFAGMIGDAYQMRDDVLDMQEDFALAVGGRRATTGALESGEAEAMREVDELVGEAKSLLIGEFGDSHAVQMLSLTADYIARRKA